MIFLDSWVFIEYFSNNENKNSAYLIENANSRVISSVVLAEVKYRISKKFGNSKASEAIDAISSLPDLRILPVTREIAEFAAELRIKYYSNARQISYIDAINLATAIKIGCDKFYTGDPDFEGIDEIKIENIKFSKIIPSIKEEIKNKVIEYLKNNKKSYPSDIADALKLDFDAVLKIVKELEKEGRIK